MRIGRGQTLDLEKLYTFFPTTHVIIQQQQGHCIWIQRGHGAKLLLISDASVHVEWGKLTGA